MEYASQEIRVNFGDEPFHFEHDDDDGDDANGTSVVDSGVPGTEVTANTFDSTDDPNNQDDSADGPGGKDGNLRIDGQKLLPTSSNGPVMTSSPRSLRDAGSADSIGKPTAEIEGNEVNKDKASKRMSTGSQKRTVTFAGLDGETATDDELSSDDGEENYESSTSLAGARDDVTKGGAVNAAFEAEDTEHQPREETNGTGDAIEEAEITEVAYF